MDRVIDIALWIVAGAAVLAIALTGLIEATRLAAAHLRLAAARQRLLDRRREIETSLRLGRECQMAITRAKAALQALTEARKEAISSLKSLDAMKIELVHEIGAPNRLYTRFEGKVGCSAAMSQVSSRNVVFHRDIWKFTNVAVVWATTAEHAKTLMESAFASRSGLRVDSITATPTGTTGAGATGAGRWAA